MQILEDADRFNHLSLLLSNIERDWGPFNCYVGTFRGVGVRSGKNGIDTYIDKGGMWEVLRQHSYECHLTKLEKAYQNMKYHFKTYFITWR